MPLEEAEHILPRLAGCFGLVAVALVVHEGIAGAGAVVHLVGNAVLRKGFL